MGIPHNTPFVYRFDMRSERIYGPQTLEWVGERYASDSQCECAPADVSGTWAVGPWKPVHIWFADMVPAGATDRQLKRLENLRIPHNREFLTRDNANQLIKTAEAKLPPTKAQITKAGNLRISVPEGATRGDIEALVDAAERKAAITALRRRKIQVPENASWEEIEAGNEAAENRNETMKLVTKLRRSGLTVADGLNLDDLEEIELAWEDLREAIREARKIGFVLNPPAGLTPSEMENLSAALGDLERHFGLSEGSLDYLVENGWLPRKPRKTAIKAALPDLFARILNGSWQGNHEDDLWLFRRALELEQSDSESGVAEFKYDAKQIAAFSRIPPSLPADTHPAGLRGWLKKRFGL